MVDKMLNVTNVSLCPLPEDSLYMKPFRLNYTQNGMEKSWDLLEVHDSVAIIIYNITRKKLVMVKQFRPAIYYNSVPKEERSKGKIDTAKYSASLGCALEFCAGIIDKDKPWNEIAQDEVHEECGYKVTLDSLQHVMTYRSGVGSSGSFQSLYYCEVTDDMKDTQGGGIEDEIIEVIEMTIPEAEKILKSKGPHTCPVSFLFALSWFMLNKASALMANAQVNFID